jgi:hypothetical protein
MQIFALFITQHLYYGDQNHMDPAWNRRCLYWSAPLYFVISNKKRNRFLTAFTVSKFIQTAGVILLSARYDLPDYYAVNIGGGLIITGYSMELFAVISFDNVF